MNELEKFVLRRDLNFFEEDYRKKLTFIQSNIKNASVLIIGAAGSIGRSVTNLIFGLSPQSLSLVDISENNLVETVRLIRSNHFNNHTDLKTYAICFGSVEFYNLLDNNEFEYVLNFAALKHVRSEKDPFTLSRMLKTNIIYPYKLALKLDKTSTVKFFNVSSDKAVNPANFMGASKRIMEIGLSSKKFSFDISFTRFANVAFSDGSLLHGFLNRLNKQQPLSAPKDISRYFISSVESARISLLSVFFGDNLDIYFPSNLKNTEIKFTDLATRFLLFNEKKPKILCDEKIAIEYFSEHKNNSSDYWPCYFFDSYADGEKLLEEFYDENDNIVSNAYDDIAVIKNKINNKNTVNFNILIDYIDETYPVDLDKNRLKNLFEIFFSGFDHILKGKNLDEHI